MIKKHKKLFDGIDQERFDGVFLPLDMKERQNGQKSVKEILMANIETVLDEIINDLDKKGR